MRWLLDYPSVQLICKPSPCNTTCTEWVYSEQDFESVKHFKTLWDKRCFIKSDILYLNSSCSASSVFYMWNVFGFFYLCVGVRERERWTVNKFTVYLTRCEIMSVMISLVNVSQPSLKLRVQQYALVNWIAKPPVPLAPKGLPLHIG